MFCKNGKVALKICFKATETFEFIFFIFVAKLLDVIWRRLGVGREMQEEKEKRQFLEKGRRKKKSLNPD